MSPSAVYGGGDPGIADDLRTIPAEFDIESIGDDLVIVQCPVQDRLYETLRSLDHPGHVDHDRIFRHA